MTVLLPPGYIQATLLWESGSIDSGNAATVLGFANVDDLLLDGVAGAISGRVDEHLAPVMSDFQALAGVNVISATESGSSGLRVGGTQPIQEPPPNTALLISMKSGQRGRRSRGRNYWPGFLPEGEVSRSGIIAPTTHAALVAAFAGFFTQLEEDFFLEPVVLQHTTPTGPNAPANPTPPFPIPPRVQEITVQSKVATQRRRLR